MLAKKPGFTLVAVLTLALGIGANTAIFSVVMAVLIRPLPYAEPERLLWLANTNPSLGVSETFLNPDDIIDYREQAESLEQVASWGTYPVNLSGGRNPERVESIYVTTNFFRTLGVKPMLGRDFLPEEGEDGSGVVIISHGLWQRQFGGDPEIIGRKIVIMGNANQPAQVIGVMPAELDFPARVDLFETYEIKERTGRGGTHNDRTIARLKPGVTVAQAQAELSAIAQRQAQQFPDTNRGWDVVVVPFQEHVFGSATVALPLLLGAAAFVLLISCTNVAGLQLARALSRHKEIAVRLALGASRGHIVRQLLIESLMLSAPGGALGLLLAMWAIDALRAFGPQSLPRLNEVSLDTQALAFTAVLSVTTGLLFGVVPALLSAKLDLTDMLKDPGGVSSGGSQRHRFRSALVISQFALAMVLMVGAGLMIKSFWRLHQTSPGFQPEQLLTAGLSLNMADYRDLDKRRQFYRQALDRVAGLPGVETAAAVSHLPFGGRTLQLAFRVEGREPVSVENQSLTDYRVVSPSFFDTMRIPLKGGRAFAEQDAEKAPIVYLVNETFAHTYFPGGDPVGSRIRLGNEGQWRGEVVGVVGDVKHRKVETEALPTIYACYLQSPPLPSFPILNFIARTADHSETMRASIREELLRTDSDQVVFYVRPMTDFIADAVAQRRLTMLLLALFALLAIVLASVGIYGLMSYLVMQRRQEIAIRRALGAQPRDVLLLVIGQGVRMSVLGGAIGIALSLALSRVLSSLLYGVSATDPFVFAGIPILLLVVALLACYIPALRAMKVAPIAALRGD